MTVIDEWGYLLQRLYDYEKRLKKLECQPISKPEKKSELENPLPNKIVFDIGCGDVILIQTSLCYDGEKGVLQAEYRRIGEYRERD